MRFFNTAGPIDPARHYTIDPLSRIDLPRFEKLIRQHKYFVLHAPRQTGKTTILLALAKHLNQSGKYNCVIVNVEAGQTARSDVSRAMRTILTRIGEAAHGQLNDRFPNEQKETILNSSGPDSALHTLLAYWSEINPKPLVLLIDEIDALVGDSLISVLRQIRSGYHQRPSNFPGSIILCGVRDVRDYRMEQEGQPVITGGSAFNIKAASIRLGNFSEKEIQTLLAQHTAETGQAFEVAAVKAVFHLTQGQPWLVNAIAEEVTEEIEQGRDRTQAITEDLIVEAKERIIERRETHLDQLADKLAEPRVHSVIAPLMTSALGSPDLKDDDISYVEDLGLIRARPQLEIANPIYREVIPRVLTYPLQVTIAQETTWYLTPEKRLDMHKLLTAFQDFFRQHAEHWIERFQYKEAGPQLLLQAFLQRIINGGGRVEREYGLGRMRTDLLVVWPFSDGEQRIVLELKVLRASRDSAEEQGIEQLAAYKDRSNAGEAHLLLFDSSERAWEEKIFHRQTEQNGAVFQIWGM
jgi:hypothetical protein